MARTSGSRGMIIVAAAGQEHIEPVCCDCESAAYPLSHWRLSVRSTGHRLDMTKWIARIRCSLCTPAAPEGTPVMAYLTSDDSDAWLLGVGNVERVRSGDRNELALRGDGTPMRIARRQGGAPRRAEGPGRSPEQAQSGRIGSVDS
jgi:hypothetical protein